jgi:hypothetical protein
MNKLLLSSTGQGVKLRIKALIPILIPVINNLGESWGVNLIPDDLDILVDSVFLIIAAVMHLRGWIRALKSK